MGESDVKQYDYCNPCMSNHPHVTSGATHTIRSIRYDTAQHVTAWCDTAKLIKSSCRFLCVDILIPKRQALLASEPETSVQLVHEIEGNGVNIEFDWEMDEYEVCTSKRFDWLAIITRLTVRVCRLL
jgi:hypothetical protein